MPAFVGRAAELAQLERLCTAADGATAALIVGDPGSGKTRLLAEFKLRTAHLGIQLQVIGYETERKVPLASASDLLRSLRTVPIYGAGLDTLVFGRGSADAGLEPLRVFEAAHRAGRASGNLVLSIDDLQWVDELSLALCHYLLRAAEAEGDRLFLVAASRPSTAASRLAAALPQLLSAERLMQIQLGPLEIADAVQLAQAVKPTLEADAARELCAVAKGSPFWVQVLAESGSGPDLTALLSARWGAVDPDAARALAVLALVAKPVTVSDLAAIESWTVDRAATAVAALERTGATVPAAGQVRLAHDLVRFAVESQISAVTQREVHRALASWLEEQAGDDDVQLLHEALQHRRQAGLPGLDLALRTVRSSRSQLLTPEALRDVAGIADEAGFLGQASELQERIAVLASQSGEQEMALSRWTLIAERHPNARVRAGALLAASRAAHRLPKRRAEAVPLLRRAQEANRDDPVFKVDLWAHEANLLRLLEHRMEDARAIADKALAAARLMTRESGGIDALTADARDAYLRALQAAFDAATIDMDQTARLAIAEEMVEIARGSLERELTAALNLAEALGSFGRLGEATELAKRVWEHARQRILPSLATMAGQTLIPYLIRQGNLADAEEVALECIGLERRISGRSGRLTFPRVAMRSVHVLYQVIRVSCGEWRVAVDELRQEVTLQPDPHHRLHPRQLIAVWLARLAGPEFSVEVLAQLEEAEVEASVAGCARCGRELRLRNAEANLRIGRIDSAEAHLEAWNSGRQADYDDELWYRHCVALVSFARGDWLSGANVLDQVQEERQRAGFHYEMLWGRLDLGAGLLDPDPRRAADEFRAAGADAEAMGAVTEGRLAEVGLRKLGVHTWRRGPAARGPELLDRLSQREREIARLVAAGVSNPDIARSLFLSRKTVERHVSNILARTGARNRTQLASLVSPGPDSNRKPSR